MSFHPLTRKSVPLALLPIAAAASLILLVPGAPEPDRVRLQSGQALEGEVLSEGPEHATVRVASGEVRLVSRRELAGLERSPPQRGPLREFTLRSGRTLTGELLGEAQACFDVRLANGTRVSLRRADVATIRSASGGR